MSETDTKAAASDVNTQLAMRRTGMSFQRTRMAADNTLMSIIRTSLSLISFGFTINQVFNKLRAAGALSGAAAARNFGAALVLLGIGMLALGIVYHVMFMHGLRSVRSEMVSEGMVHGRSKFPPSLTLVTALALLLIGCIAIAGLMLHIGPFS